MGSDRYEGRSTYTGASSDADVVPVKVTAEAEKRYSDELKLHEWVDPKGPAHLGPVRLSLNRYEEMDSFFKLLIGIAMAVENLLDTTGSMGDNVDKAFANLKQFYDMLVRGNLPVLGGYDVEIATANFNDIVDRQTSWEPKPVLCRSQFEMAKKIEDEMTYLVPGHGGGGNYKEDSQFGLFAAAYLTQCVINRYGLKWYHFTVSDEPTVPTIDLKWLKEIFGEDVLERAKEAGWYLDPDYLPDTAQAVKDLQKNAHAFFLHVPGMHIGNKDYSGRKDYDEATIEQWTALYGKDYVVELPEGTKYLHYVEAVIIGLTEGVLDITTAKTFLTDLGLERHEANMIVRAVRHIPLGAQMLAENFGKLPKKDDIFKTKTDLWPMIPEEIAAAEEAAETEAEKGPQWV